MSLSIEIIGLEEVQQLIKDMPEVGRKTVATSINRTATHTKSNVSTKAREKSTVKAKYAKASIVIPGKATVNILNSRVVITGKRIPLIGYQTSKTKKGVKARIFKSGSLKLRPRSFIAIMKNGHKGVFWRDWENDGSGFLVHRLGITELTDLSIPQLINDQRVWVSVQKDADETLQKELEKNLKYFMEKYK